MRQCSVHSCSCPWSSILYKIWKSERNVGQKCHSENMTTSLWIGLSLKKSSVFIRIALVSPNITSQEESNEPNNSRLETIAHKQMCPNSPSQNHQRATFLLRHSFIHSKFHFMAWILCQARRLESWRNYSVSGITLFYSEFLIIVINSCISQFFFLVLFFNLSLKTHDMHLLLTL